MSTTKNFLYRYKSPLGTFVITGENSRFCLFFNDNLEQIANNPHTLAEMVACFCLANPDWDDYKGNINGVPADLTFWESAK